MGKQVTIYHNPRCSKSRQTLALLRERGLDVAIVEYLREPPSVERLAEICEGLGVEPQDIIRVKEPAFSELGLSKSDKRPRRDWLRLMHENPILIERPIVESGGRFAIGRPPEKVLDVL